MNEDLTGQGGARVAFPRAVRGRRTAGTAGTAWLERTNPLTRLSLRAAQGVYDTARTGGLARLQYIYAEIERTDPTLLVCVERRLSALSSLGWRVTADGDDGEAQAQKARLEEVLNAAEGLTDAIEHLGLAFFRGHSFAAPYWAGGHLAFQLPPSWEFNHADGSDAWWHNPEVREEGPGGPGQVRFDPADTLHLVRRRAVDYPALALFLRRDVAEDQWGRFLERYGIPPVILEMPPMAGTADAERFAEAARSVYEAMCGAVPNGTKVNTLEEARGTDPFSAFIEHQEKTLVRLCTGGTLGSIAEATGIGGGASDAQADVWREIVSRDAAAIGEEFTRWFGRFLFGGRMKCRFELGLEKRETPAEVFETAAKAVAAGYRVDKAELEEKTGLRLEAAGGGFEPQGLGSREQGLGSGAVAPRPQTLDPQEAKGFAQPLAPLTDPKPQSLDPSPSKTALQTHEKPLQNARRDSDGQGGGLGDPPLKSQKFGLLDDWADSLAEELAEEAARAAAGAASDGGAGAPEPPEEEITQADAEEIYRQLTGEEAS